MKYQEQNEPRKPAGGNNEGPAGEGDKNGPAMSLRFDEGKPDTEKKQ